jgi:hypothetical protein
LGQLGEGHTQILVFEALLGDGEVAEADFDLASLAEDAEVEIGVAVPGVFVVELHDEPPNYFKPAAWHDAMSAALESSSAYAITAIEFDENRRANPNLITLTTNADAIVRCAAAT